MARAFCGYLILGYRGMRSVSSRSDNQDKHEIFPREDAGGDNPLASEWMHLAQAGGRDIAQPKANADGINKTLAQIDGNNPLVIDGSLDFDRQAPLRQFVQAKGADDASEIDDALSKKADNQSAQIDKIADARSNSFTSDWFGNS